VPLNSAGSVKGSGLSMARKQVVITTAINMRNLKLKGITELKSKKRRESKQKMN